MRELAAEGGITLSMMKSIISFFVVAISLGVLSACVTSSQTLTPTTISYTDGTRTLIAACGGDINAYCKGIKPGANRLQNCLFENAAKISSQCKQSHDAVFKSLAARAKAQANVPRLCEASAKRVCSNFRSGEARILRCLIRKDNVRKVDRSCNQAITDAGWR